MADRTSIEWTDHTFNPWVGCMKVSPLCDNCYAADLVTSKKWFTPDPASQARIDAASYLWGEPGDRPHGGSRMTTLKRRTAGNTAKCTSSEVLGQSGGGFSGELASSGFDI